MRVFISWSGEFSRKVAKRLKAWIEITIQSANVFYSPNDIEKGENWNSRLSEELEQSNFGIVCLTPENVLAPWIHFEAGALSKATDSRVSAIMLGITPSDIKGPLARLQNTTCTREDFFLLLQSINKFSESPLKPETLKAAFDNSYGSFMSDIDTIIKDYISRTPTLKAEKDKHEDRNSDAIQEILRIARSLDTNLRTLPGNLIVALDSILKQSNDHPITVDVSCPPAYVKDVLPIIHHYAWSPSDEKNAEYLLRSHNACTFSIPNSSFDTFKALLRNISPNIKVLG